MKLRVGIVGLGQAWETRHRPALRALSDRFEVKAVCCEVAHLAQQAARDFSAAEVDGFRALAYVGDNQTGLSPVTATPTRASPASARRSTSTWIAGPRMVGEIVCGYSENVSIYWW